MFANPFAACYVKPTAKTMGGNGRRVGWYKANRASQERIRSLHPFFLSLPPPPSPLNFPPALFTTHRRVTFSKLLRLLYSHACLFSCYAVLLSRLCENPLRIHVHFLALSSLSLSLIYSFGRVKFCGFKLPVRATLSISDIRHARVKLAFSCIS